MSLLVVMGSGETAPSLVKVHREVDHATRAEGPAVLLDTTFGFQVNADDLVQKTSTYFSASVGLPVQLASWRRADDPQAFPSQTGQLLVDRLNSLPAPAVTQHEVRFEVQLTFPT